MSSPCCTGITGELLERLQAADDHLIERGENLQARQLAHELEDEHGLKEANDLAFAKRSSGKAFFRINYVRNQGELASLELLASAQVFGVTESLCGPNFVPTCASLVFKKAGNGEMIP